MIYLDNAATTKTDDEVVAAMLPFISDNYGNPSGIYKLAVHSRGAVNKAREIIAGTLSCKPSEIYFTSGGTEANNWILHKAIGISPIKRHIITSAIEHNSVLSTCKQLEKEGCILTVLGVSEDGRIDLNELERAIRPDTALISIMYANNEVGTIEPVHEIGRIARKHNVLFHTDAVQTYGHIPINAGDANIDFLTASGHKFHGPKGTGFAYIREGIKCAPFIYGGGQEKHKRAGTENVPAIVGMGKAAELAHRNMKQHMEYVTDLRDYMIDRILTEIPYTRLNGSRNNRLPNNVNLCFQFIEGEELLIMLDMKCICASSGSACSTGSTEPSHVLKAIGVPEEYIRGSIRLTLSHLNTKSDIDITVNCLREVIEKLRKASPAYKAFQMRKR